MSMSKITSRAADHGATHAHAGTRWSRVCLRTGVAALAAAGFAGLAAPAAAYEIEGPLIKVGIEGADRYIVCNGAKLLLHPDAEITSPTAKVDFGALTSPNFLEAGHGNTGSAREGFQGGTCIVTGDDSTGRALSVFVEIAENVIVGNGGFDATKGFQILGVQIVPITDGRMSATKFAAGLFNASGQPIAPTRTEVARNEYGFGVDLSTVVSPDFAGAEGYLSAAGEPKLYAHTIETSGGKLLDATPRASLQRAQCRNEPSGGKDQIEILGGCVLGGARTVQIWTRPTSAGTLTPLKTPTGANAVASCVADPAAPGFGLYRFRNDRLTLAGDVCPSDITVTLDAANFDFAPSDNR